jgi:CubicO group peptidase (beta-lactamase class C family)
MPQAMPDADPHADPDADPDVDGALEAPFDAVQAAIVESGFSGAVRVDVAGRTAFARAHGAAHRGLGVPNTLDTQFAIASGAKAFTAMAVMSLVDDGVLTLDAPVRRWLRDDLPLVADDVTVEHLLAHRSGIGDYLHEDDHEITDYVMPVPVHRLAAAEDYLAVLDGFPAVFPAGERFAYNNGGFVVLALLAERASGVPYHDLVTTRVTDRAGMADTAFLRSDALPGRAALGYLSAGDDLRTHVLHLPVRGVGDGGAYSTVADFAAFWSAAAGGRIVGADTFARMVTALSVDPDPDSSFRYGLGFWLEPEGDGVLVEGYDAGVSFRSLHRPSTGLTWTVVSNWTDGAWPVARALGHAFPAT